MEVSIIMPVYNETDLLKRSISSIRNQTFQDWELIIVDDGSKDDVKRICESYVKGDSRIHFYGQKHSGQANARNLGLSLAQGNYIAFADADDVMHPQMLEQLYANIVSTGRSIAVCGFKPVKQLPEYPVYEKCNCKVIDVFKDSKTVKSAKIKDNVYLWNKLYCRSLFEDIRFAAGRFYEDLAIMHQLFAKAGEISYNPNVLYYYYRNPHGTIDTVDEKKIKDCLWAYGERIRFYVQGGYKKDLNHVTHSFLYKAYALYNIVEEKDVGDKTKIKKIIRRRVKNTFFTYDLVKFLPIHGKVRYWAFVYYPVVFEADLWRRAWCKRFR